MSKIGTGLTRRLWLGGGAAALALSASSIRSRAADWPARLVTMIVPYSAGGIADLLGRLFGQILSEKYGQSFIVENRTGGSGVVGASIVDRATPDGQTLLLTAPGPLVLIPQLQKVPYDASRFMPVNIVGHFPLLFAIKSSIPAKTLTEFIGYAKANPGKLNYSSGGVGQVSHLVTALFAQRTGLNITHIPYKGSAPATAALLSGEVDMFFGIPSELVPHVSENKFKILATTAPERMSIFPGTPTFNETLPGFKIEAWNGVLAPPGTPHEIVSKIADAFDIAAKTPLVVERLGKLGVIPGGGTPGQFAQIIADDKVFYRDAIKAAGLTTQL